MTAKVRSQLYKPSMKVKLLCCLLSEHKGSDDLFWPDCHVFIYLFTHLPNRAEYNTILPCELRHFPLCCKFPLSSSLVGTSEKHINAACAHVLRMKKSLPVEREHPPQHTACLAKHAEMRSRHLVKEYPPTNLWCWTISKALCLNTHWFDVNF